MCRSREKNQNYDYKKNSRDLEERKDKQREDKMVSLREKNKPLTLEQ